MTRVVLIRHGRSTANAEGLLAGRAEGVALDDAGRAQAMELRTSFDGLPFAGVYCSPIQRCRETAELAGFPEVEVVDDLTECDYGAWTGLKLDQLRTESIWDEIQADPASVTFPGGESMQNMFDRVTGIALDLAGRHGDDETIAVFSHGDPIKAILAHAFGMGLKDFQRLHVNPAGVSVVQYGKERPMVLCVNAGGDLRSLIGASHGPTVGGGDVAQAK